MIRLNGQTGISLKQHLDFFHHFSINIFVRETYSVFRSWVSSVRRKTDGWILARSTSNNLHFTSI